MRRSCRLIICFDDFAAAFLFIIQKKLEVAPNLELHVSTQAGVTNYQAANAFYQLGARRVVLAREMDLQAVPSRHFGV